MSEKHGLYPAQARVLVDALKTMDYDFGSLTEFESELFEDAGVEPPDGWVVLDEPRLATLSTPDGHKVALVLFPDLPEGEDRPSKNLVRKLEKLMAGAREDHDLVLAVSPWGMWPEKDYLNETEAGPDILLGAGPGMEVQGTFMARDRVFWVRAYSKGKSINRIDLMAWPDKADRTWTPDDDTIRAEFGTLRDTVPEDPEVLDILSGTPGQ